MSLDYPKKFRPARESDGGHQELVPGFANDRLEAGETEHSAFLNNTSGYPDFEASMVGNYRGQLDSLLVTVPEGYHDWEDKISTSKNVDGFMERELNKGFMKSVKARNNQRVLTQPVTPETKETPSLLIRPATVSDVRGIAELYEQHGVLQTFQRSVGTGDFKNRGGIITHDERYRRLIQEGEPMLIACDRQSRERIVGLFCAHQEGGIDDYFQCLFEEKDSQEKTGELDELKNAIASGRTTMLRELLVTQGLPRDMIATPYLLYRHMLEQEREKGKDTLLAEINSILAAWFNGNQVFSGSLPNGPSFNLHKRLDARDVGNVVREVKVRCGANTKRLLVESHLIAVDINHALGKVKDAIGRIEATQKVVSGETVH